MTIVEKIIQSIGDAVGVPVYYHDEPTLNVKTSTMSFPCAIFQLLVNGNIVQEAGQMKEQVTAAVFFVDRSEFDFDAKNNERIIGDCKALAFSWLSSLNTSGMLNVQAVNRTSRVYDRYDDILTGFGVSVDIMELVGECLGTVPGCNDFNADFNFDFGGECDQPTDNDFNLDFNYDFNA